MSALIESVCGFNLELGHTEDYQNMTVCTAWYSVKRCRLQFTSSQFGTPAKTVCLKSLFSFADTLLSGWFLILEYLDDRFPN